MNMKQLNITITLIILISASLLPSRAGNITTTPAFDKNNNYTVTVGPKADGTADVTFTVTTGDTILSLSGTFTNAPDAGTTFSGSGGTRTKTVNYPATAAGLLSPVTITITTKDSTGANCTTSLWRPEYSTRHPSAMCFAGNLSSSLGFDFTSFLPTVRSLAISLFSTETSAKTVTQTSNFNVLFVNKQISNKKIKETLAH
jgi:hypothetical protein